MSEIPHIELNTTRRCVHARSHTCIQRDEPCTRRHITSGRARGMKMCMLGTHESGGLRATSHDTLSKMSERLYRDGGARGCYTRPYYTFSDGPVAHLTFVTGFRTCARNQRDPTPDHHRRTLLIHGSDARTAAALKRVSARTRWHAINPPCEPPATKMRAASTRSATASSAARTSATSCSPIRPGRLSSGSCPNPIEPR